MKKSLYLYKPNIKMKNWEYEVATVVTQSGQTLKEKMNEFGKGGWEVFNVVKDGKDSYILFMKREKEKVDWSPMGF